MESLGGFEISQLRNIPPGYVVQSHTVQPLNSNGLHFSSDVSEVKVILKNERGQELFLEFISKRLPKPEKQIVVNSKLGFIKEATFYEKLVPEYQKIQQDHTVEVQNIFPNIHFVSDSEILLDDLRQFHFQTCKERLNKEHTLLVLQELAKFHSTGVVLKLSNPDIFKTKLAVVADPALQNEGNPNKEKIDKQFRSEIYTIIKCMKGFENFSDSIDTVLSNIDKTKLPVAREPYATLLHNDLWNGNILFKYSPINEPIEVKFIDFQTTIYNSPARDLVYFLLTSVEAEVLEAFTELIRFYHSVFINYLSSFGVDVAKFSFEMLMNEINIYGPTKLKHMVKLFKTRNCNDIDASKFNFELQNIITMFHERGWL